MAADLAPPLQSVRPFADFAPELARRGLAVVPCPGDDGKSPKGAARSFGRWRKRPSLATIQKFSETWGDANIGIVTSLSNLTVVDVDGDERLVQFVISRIGPTPLITSTPSGGKHLFYRAGGERNANLRRHGLSVDVKGSAAGIVVVPPSIRPSTGKPYSFAQGSWDDLGRLPKAELRALTEGARYEALSSVMPGTRNSSLFRHALREARYCDDEGALIDIVMTANVALPVPLDDREVRRVAQSAWGYEERGENWVGREARAIVLGSVTAKLIQLPHGSDALALYTLLQQSHGARTRRAEPFAISPNNMARANVLGEWGARRIRNARGTLLDAGLLVQTYKGGAGPRDPHRFQFSPLERGRGQEGEKSV